MKIFFSQHYSRNKGNISLLYATVEVLKKKYPDAEIVVSSFDPDDTNKTFGYDTCEWPFLTRKIVDAGGLKKILIAAIQSFYVIMSVLIAMLLRFKIIKPSKLGTSFNALKEIYESNVVISPGGHLFTNYNKIVPVFAHFFPCLLSSIVKIPYVVMAQTIGPFFGTWSIPGKIMTRFVLRKADVVTIRDNNSFEQISKLNVKTRDIRQTNELVFLYPDDEEFTVSKTKNKLGITFHHIYYKRWMTKEDYIERMVKFINQLIKNHNLEISFISMEKGSEHKSDIPLLKEIKGKLSDPNKVEIVTISQSPNELLRVFESLNFLIATKTHSVVYGLRKCIPTLAIAYEKKTDDFMSYFEQENLSIPLSDFDPDIAVDKFQEMVLKEVEIEDTIRKNLISVQTQAMENIELLTKYY